MSSPTRGAAVKGPQTSSSRPSSLKPKILLRKEASDLIPEPGPHPLHTCSIPEHRDPLLLVLGSLKSFIFLKSRGPGGERAPSARAGRAAGA